MMRISLSAKAYELLKKEILTCVFEPGQQLIQHQLAERYGLGVSPVREALHRLAQEGFVQPVPRFGYTVCYVSLSDVHEIYELRLILEPAAARLAAERANADELKAIAQQADHRQSYRQGGSHIPNTPFHRAIAAACGNRRLQDDTFRVLDELTRVFYLGLDLSDRLDEMQDAHGALVRALDRRNAAEAEQLMRNQILQSRQLVLEALVQRYGVLAVSRINSPQAFG